MAISRSSRPRAIGQDLDALLQRIERTYPDPGHRIWDVWDTTVGAELAARCRPLELRNGRLLVAVTSSAWLQQIQFLRDRICRSLNQALGEEVVREVRLRIAEVPPPPAPAPRREDDQEWRRVQLAEPELQQIDAELATIDDEQLRAVLRRVRVRAEKVRRVRADPAE